MTVSRALRAPEADGSVLAEPPLSQIGSTLADNRRLLNSANIHILGRPLSGLRQEAKHAALDAARRYFADAGEPVPVSESDSILLAGHQPELFHPGVWIKNFALNELARRHHATPINLIVDNDIAKNAAIPVPVWSRGVDARRRIGDLSHRTEIYHAHAVALDKQTGEAPYEERRVVDEGMFSAFPERVLTLMRGWELQPMLPLLWERVLRERNRTPLLGERIARGRRSIERDWGCHNLELPISLLAGTEPFIIFTQHILSELPRFHAIHNDCLRDYRRRHGLRSRSHPVPDLAKDGDWFETPFWAWYAGDERRGRLMARSTETKIDLRTNHTDRINVSELKIRPRALTNTLFARLFLGDLFIHGIGGAKYDELTDEIIRRFYGIEPPTFLTLTGTLRLPLPTFDASEAKCAELSRRVRDIRWNPQRYLADATTPAEGDLIRDKENWIQRSVSTRDERRTRCRQLRKLNAALQPAVARVARDVETAQARCISELEINCTLRRRDYAFCLFPEEMLRSFCVHFV